MTAPLVTKRRAFSLTELLIVIALIILILAMAVPVYNAMSNDRSISAAENVVSAMLQRARAKAIGLQEKRGVLFFEDPVSKNNMMTIVRLVDEAGQNAPWIELETPDTEAEPLPKGVGAALLEGWDHTESEASKTRYRSVGLVVFDGKGRLILQRVAFANRINSGIAMGSQFWAKYRLLETDDSGGKFMIPQPPANITPAMRPPYTSQVGIMLYDKSKLSSALGATPGQSQINEWMGKNAYAVVVNRYNGTLMKGER